MSSLASGAPPSSSAASGSTSSGSPLDLFTSSLSALCIAAGPPAPSFSLQDIDACIYIVLDHPSLYSGVFAAVDARLSQDDAATPMSVRAMLWSLLTRFCDRAWNGPTRHEECSVLLAPQLYRLVMLVLPKWSDASLNVGLTRQSLLKWFAQADSGSGNAPFKRHQLLNVIKYVEGYVYEPPPPSDTERLERRERKRAKRREREAAEERSKKKQRRDSAAHRTPDSASRMSSPRSPDSASRSRSGSRSSSSSRSASPVSPTRLRYLNRTVISHTASEEAAASRFLEHIRASQKRSHVESTLRPAGESLQGWEEWAETRQNIRRQRIALAKQTQEQQQQQQSLIPSLPLPPPQPVPAESAAPSATDAATSSTLPLPPPPSAPPATSLEAFLASWTSTRNHWKATRDAIGDAEGAVSDGGQHELDIWLAYYQQHRLPMPSHNIPNGATRIWAKLNETHAMEATKHQGLLLPRPPPTRLYAPTDVPATHTS